MRESNYRTQRDPNLGEYDDDACARAPKPNKSLSPESYAAYVTYTLWLTKASLSRQKSLLLTKATPVQQMIEQKYELPQT